MESLRQESSRALATADAREKPMRRETPDWPDPAPALRYSPMPLNKEASLALSWREQEQRPQAIHSASRVDRLLPALCNPEQERRFGAGQQAARRAEGQVAQVHAFVTKADRLVAPQLPALRPQAQTPHSRGGLRWLGDVPRPLSSTTPVLLCLDPCGTPTAQWRATLGVRSDAAGTHRALWHWLRSTSFARSARRTDAPDGETARPRLLHRSAVQRSR